MSREERRLAGVTGGLIYLVGALTMLVYLALASDRVQAPLLLAALIAAGLLWSAAGLTMVPWEHGPAWLAHPGMLAALPLIGVAMAASGGAESPARFFLILIAVFVTYFFTARAAAGYVAGCALVLLSPLAYEAAPTHPAYLAETVVFMVVLTGTAACILAGRRVQQRLGARARRLAGEQAALRRVATAIAAGSAPGGVLAPGGTFALVASEVGHLLGADAATVLKFDRLDSALVAGVWTGDAPGLEPGSRLAMPAGAALAQVHDSGRGLTFEDIQREPVHGAAAALGHRAAILVPIRVRGELWGALCVASLQAARWGERDQARAQAFAELLSTAVAETEDRARLVEQTAVDPLTALPNHRSFQARLREEVGRALRHARPLSLALVDVDRFAEINRAAGHDAGDDVLRQLAARLRGALRGEDVLARTGGDEFAVLLPETGRRQAYLVLERVRAAAAATEIPGGRRMTISAGVCDTGLAEDPETLYELAGGALYWSKLNGRDVTWIYDPEVVRSLSAQQRAEYLERSQALIGLRALARAIDAKDPSTRQHSDRVATLACRLAEAAGWPAARVAALHEAALVHDVGKIGVPDAVLLKPGRLTPEEYEQVKEHAELGARIVAEVLSPEQVRWVRCHHERPDGRGYPDGLRGEMIPEGGALLAMADAFDVMTSARSYSAPTPIDEAVAECRELSGAQFHPAAVAALELLHARGLLEPPPPRRPRAVAACYGLAPDRSTSAP